MKSLKHLLCMLAMLGLAAVSFGQAQPAAPTPAKATAEKPAGKAKAGKKAGKAKTAGKAKAAGKASTATATKPTSSTVAKAAAPKAGATKAAPKAGAAKAAGKAKATGKAKGTAKKATAKRAQPSAAELAAAKACPAFGAITRGGNWMQRHEGFVAQAKKDKIDLLFIGDSITDGWNKQPELWNKYYAPLKAANFGIGGDRTENIIWRITHGELDGIHPKAIVMLIGTNNTSKGDSAQDIARAITLIVNTMKTRLPQTKILLLGVYPRGQKPDDTQTKQYRENITETNNLIKGLDDGSSVRYLYFGDKFLSPDGTISKEIMPDFLHLSTAGYQIWADSINPVLKEMMQ